MHASNTLDSITTLLLPWEHAIAKSTHGGKGLSSPKKISLITVNHLAVIVLVTVNLKVAFKYPDRHFNSGINIERPVKPHHDTPAHSCYTPGYDRFVMKFGKTKTKNISSMHVVLKLICTFY